MRKMKDSGIEWIGEIPDGWGLYKIGSLFKCRNEKVNDTDYLPLSVSKGGIVPQMENVAKSEANDNRKLVLANDFVINSRSDRKQSCGISPLDGSVSLINTVLYTDMKDIILPQYANIIMKNYGFAEEFYRWGHGIVADLWTTRWQEMKSIVLPLPTVSVQQGIIDKLNDNLSKVENLIAVQQAQIEKLKEYKQAVITEAVTKGLDKNAPMKDSGITWIGNIPESWEVCRIKHIADANIENSFTDGDWIESGDISESGIKYFTTGNVGDGKFKYQGEGYITEDTFTKLNCKFAYCGDFIISRLNQPYGRSCIIPKDIDRCVLAVDIVVLRPKKDFDKRYLCYMTQCPNYQQMVGNKARGTAMKRISRSNLGDIFLLKPSLAEQHQIADYLDKKCAKIDKLISIKQQKIEKLQEYKKSLIYEYVTGKKEIV